MSEVIENAEMNNQLDESEAIFHGNIETLLIAEKLDDALTPGYQVEFDPGEAEEAGAFREDALSEEDAAESNIDLIDAINKEPKQ